MMTADRETPDTEWSNSVVNVGHGRGFVVGDGAERFVITAAHCLPRLPSPMPSSFLLLHERTYPKLIGPTGRARPAIWAECLFVDLLADLALLGCPDNQELSDEAEAYEEFLDARKPLPLGRLGLRRPLCELDESGGPILLRAEAECSAWLLSLDGTWRSCGVRAFDRGLWVSNAIGGIVAGMSGSPILSANGAAIGVVSCSSGGADGSHIEGPGPFLPRNLPGWIIDRLSSIWVPSNEDRLIAEALSSEGEPARLIARRLGVSTDDLRDQCAAELSGETAKERYRQSEARLIAIASGSTGADSITRGRARAFLKQYGTASQPG